ncbi:MAG: gamma carbonic anhydrase family protein [Evtepia gabavorous]
MPKIHPTAWVAPGAFVRGDVTIDEQANIWYNAVLRGDQESITVGKATSVQDNCVLHGTRAATWWWANTSPWATGRSFTAARWRTTASSA